MSKFYFSIGIYISTLITGVFYFYPSDNHILPFFILVVSVVYLLFLLSMSMFIGLNFFIKSINQNKTPEIVLTFDDGPHPKNTLRILDILDEYEVKAVFFMIGKNVEAYPEIAKEVANRGHQIGMHSHNHSFNFGFLNGNKLKLEFKKCASVIEKVTGYKAKFFRPPFGVTNPIIARQVRHQNLLTIGWNVRSFDTTSKSPDKIVRRVIKQVGQSSIILLHDRLDQTSEALPQIIEKIMGMGFALGKLSTDGSIHEK